MSRKGGRELVGIGNCVDASIQGFEDYIKKSKQRLITVASNNIRTEKKNKKTWNQKWEEKQLY